MPDQPRPYRKHTTVLREWLPLAGARLADIGCGRGGIARVLAREGAEVVALDPQPAALLHGRRNEDPDAVGGPIHYVAAVGEALPLAGACLDAAVCFNALHHVPVDRQDAALAEARRVLKPDARLVVVEPLAEGPNFEIVRHIEDETEVRAAAYEALCRVGRQAGWRLLHESEYVVAVRHASFEAFRDGVVAVDPAREAAVARHEDWMRGRFETAARAAEGAFWLDQPCRVTVLAKTAAD